MPASRDNDAGDIKALLKVMQRLRDPVSGCPWDRRQNFASIAPHTLEEAYEVADAIERGDLDGLRDELGDLLFQVVFHAEMAREAEAFGFADVVDGLVGKLVGRHPHVFGDSTVQDEAELHRIWEAGKAEERQARAGTEAALSALEGVPLNLPALSRAQKLQRRAARVGFDWPEVGGVLDKLDEELGELRQAMRQADEADIQAELGDALFTLVNLARHLQIDAERALREANGRFERRFRRLESLAEDDGRRPQDCDAERLDRYWNQAKRDTAEP